MRSILILALLCAPAWGASAKETLAAIRRVETGGLPNHGRGAIGDGGRSIGPMQIQFRYWKDAGIRGQWSDCNRLDYSERVVLAYWKKYCPEALRRGDSETLARIHNSGPGWRKKKHLTNGYWAKVKRELERSAR